MERAAKTESITDTIKQTLQNPPKEQTTPKPLSEHFKEIELDEQEIQLALYEARKKKFQANELRNYWDKVNTVPEVELLSAHGAKLELKNKIQNRSPLKQFNHYPEYDNILEIIGQWICGEGKLNPNKGLFLMGTTGCGKTEIMNALMLNQKQSFCCYTAADLARYAQTEGDYGIIDRVIQNDYIAIADLKYRQKKTGIFIDDMGTENEVNVYGNKKNVVAELIVEYYARCFKNGHLFHATTNLNAEQIKQIYGDRVTSRLREMVNVISFKDAIDFRK